MNKRNTFSGVLLLVVIALPVGTAAAQVPAANGPVCVPVPGIPCPGSSHASIGSAGSLNSVVTEQVVSAVAGAFFQWLLNDDPKAAAKKQQMLQELQARQAEAERQHKIEEAARLEVICSRLAATLKLSGLPKLALKDAGSAGGLQLKLGDSDSGHIGIRGLPGIALNDNTENGGTTPYGIPGLPGIYTNGPGSGSGSATSSESKLQLKSGDDAPVQPAANPVPTPLPPAPTDGTSISQSMVEGIRDPQNMTPQQLADAATLASRLPPEEQQRLMNAAAANARGTTGDVASQAATSAATSEPVASQLQQVADASKAAASAQGLDDAAAKARNAFDQTIAGTTRPGVALAGTSVSVPASSPSQPVVTSGPVSGTSSGYSARPATPIISLTTSSGETTSKPVGVVVQSKLEADGVPCPPAIQKLIPSRQQLLTELALRHAQLDSLKNTITRLNRSIQLDQQQFAVWEDEATAGLDRVKKRIWDLPTQFVFDNFVQAKEDKFEELKDKGMMTEFDKDQLSKLNRAKELKSFDDFRKWVTENKNDWAMIEDGFRQLIDALPLKGTPKAYVRCAKDLIDNAYDLTDLVATTENVNQLDHNSTQFLEATRRNGERMKALVTQIQELEVQLNSIPALPNGSPCREVGTAAQVR